MRSFPVMIRFLTAAALWLAVTPPMSFAAPVEPTSEQIDSAPCMAALAAGDDDRIIASFAALIGNAKAPRSDRDKAAVSSAASS